MVARARPYAWLTLALGTYTITIMFRDGMLAGQDCNGDAGNNATDADGFTYPERQWFWRGNLCDALVQNVGRRP